MSSEAPDELKSEVKPLDMEKQTLQTNDVFKEDVLETKTLNSKKESNIAVTKNPFCFVVFLFLGTTQLIGWNTLLNSMSTTMNLRFPENKDPTSTVTATFSTATLLVTGILFSYMRPSVFLANVGLVTIGVANLAYMCCLVFCGSSTVTVFLHIIAFCMGSSSVILGFAGFGLSSMIPPNYAGAASAGLGVSGFISFAVWMLSAYWIFPSDSAGVRNAVIVIVLICILFSVISFVLLNILTSKEWMKQTINDLKNQTEANVEEQDGKSEIFVLLKNPQIIWLTLACALHFTLTLTCFPSLGPVNWHLINWKADFITGLFQVFDLLSRYLPNVIPLLLTSPVKTIAFTFARSVFVLTFMLSFKLMENAFFQSFAVKIIQMILMALTNGWLATVFFVLIPDTVTKPSQKGKSVALALLATYFGITAGQWIGYGFTKI